MYVDSFQSVRTTTNNKLNLKSKFQIIKMSARNWFLKMYVNHRTFWKAPKCFNYL